jgi:hypothetical protein
VKGRFCVLRVEARGRRELVTVVGMLPEVQAGRIVEVYKERTFEVIDADRQSLTSVDSIPFNASRA